MERIFNTLAWLSLLMVPATAVILLILSVSNAVHDMEHCFLQAEDGTTVPCSYHSTTEGR